MTELFTVGNIITVMSVFFMCVTTFTWVKLTVIRHEAQLFDEKGNPRLVSYEAHERMRVACRSELCTEAKHNKELVSRIEALQTNKNNDWIEEMKLLREEIKNLSKCVTLLSVGEKC